MYTYGSKRYSRFGIDSWHKVERFSIGVEHDSDSYGTESTSFHFDVTTGCGEYLEVREIEANYSENSVGSRCKKCFNE